MLIKAVLYLRILMHTKWWLGCPEGRGHMADLVVNKKILKWILGK
jgi:hypothetical protein